MSIKSIKEKELLVNFARAMGQEVDPRLVEDVERINAIRNRVRESVSENIFKDLGAAVASAPKYEQDDGPLTEVQLEQIKESVVPEIEFPVPPSLDELLLVLNEQIEEVKNELVQTQPEEESPETETSVSDTPEPVAEQTISDRTSDFLSKSKDSFQQPDPLKVAPDIDAITKKLRFLEQWISKVSMAGPGGGAVNLKDLDDVSKYSVATATNNQVLSYNAAMKFWVARSLAAGGGINWTDLSVTTNTANGNGSLAYNDSNGVFTFTPANVISSNIDLTGYATVANLNLKANISDLTTSNVIELTNLYFTNTRVVSALTAGNNITIESNGRISSSTQIQSDWNDANSSNLSYIKNKPSIPDITNIEEVLTVTGEPMGHVDATQSTVSFDANTRTFSIAPVAASFDVWVKGTKQTYTTTQSVTLSNTSGIYYIYFDSNGLGAQTDYFTWDEQAPTALVYYNKVTGLAPYFADERHGTTLDWQTHEYLHRTRGAVIANGFSVGSYTIGGAVQLDIANGTFFDEDLQIDVTHSNTPTANTWEQDLQGPAQIPMFYLSGTGWVRDNPTGYLNKQGTSRPRYNSLSGGVWSVADIDNNKYGTTFIVATNNLTYPIIAIMSQSAHANQGDAEGLEFSDLVLTGFPVAEFRLLYKVVFKANSTHGTLTSVWDLRQLSATTPSAAIGSDHGLLSGLVDDDHPQYLLRTDANSIVYGNVIQLGYITQSNLTGLTYNTQLLSYATVSNITLKANVSDLTTANVVESVSNLYFTNARAVAAVTNTALSNVTISYAPATTSGYGIIVNAANTQGGTGYSDFLKVTNTSGGATNPNKSFRLNSTGGIEIINSAYTSTLFSLSDAGAMNVSGSYQVNGKQAVNGPAFSAYPTSPAQTIATASSVRVNLGNEEYDIGSCYDAPNSKFQPNMEGYYQLNAAVRIDGSSGTGERMIVIYKNGAEYKRGTNESGTEASASFFSMTVSCQAYANGSTDYFEVYVVQNSGFNRTVSEFQQISYFQGCMLRGA